MCGIFGFSFIDAQGKELVGEGRRAVLAFKLAIANDIRGGQSWGVVRVKDDTTYKIERGLGELAERPFQLLGAHTMMAHTRWATHGDRTVANAHPFEIGNIVGAHNGILYNHFTLNQRHDRKFAVDSMHAFAHMHEGKDFEEIEGYGTLEWFYKEQPARIYLCQMRNGDLAVAGLGSEENPRGIVWSSDEKHLREALRAAGIRKYFEYKIQSERVYYVEHGTLYYTERFLKISESKVSSKGWQDYGDYKGSTTGYVSKYLGQHDKDEDEKTIAEYDSKWRDRLEAEAIKQAREKLQAASESGDAEAAQILAEEAAGEADVKDLLLAVDAGVGDDIPTKDEEEAAMAAVMATGEETFMSDMERMSRRWERIENGINSGKINDEDIDLVLAMKGR